jgi:hypothetical protein
MEGVCHMGAAVFHVLFNAIAALLAGCNRVRKTGDGKRFFYSMLLVFGLIIACRLPRYLELEESASGGGIPQFGNPWRWRLCGCGREWNHPSIFEINITVKGDSSLKRYF